MRVTDQFADGYHLHVFGQYDMVCVKCGAKTPKWVCPRCQSKAVHESMVKK